MHCESLVILAGGNSSRMKKSSQVSLSEEEIYQANNLNKCLMAVDKLKTPFLSYLLSIAASAGFKNFYILTGSDNFQFKKYLGRDIDKLKEKGCNIRFAKQHVPFGRIKPLGTADALLQTLNQYPDLVDSSFAVCNSDNLYSQNAFSLLRQNSSENAMIAYNQEYLKFSLQKIRTFSVLKLNDDGYVTDILEKPKSSKIQQFKNADGTFRVSMNAFKFQGRVIYPYLKDCPLNVIRNEKELPTALRNFILDFPNKCIGIPLSEYVPDLTSKKDIALVKDYLDNNSSKYLL